MAARAGVARWPPLLQTPSNSPRLWTSLRQLAGALVIAVVSIPIGNYLWDYYIKWGTGTANLDVVIRLYPNLSGKLTEPPDKYTISELLHKKIQEIYEAPRPEGSLDSVPSILDDFDRLNKFVDEASALLVSEQAKLLARSSGLAEVSMQNNGSSSFERIRLYFPQIMIFTPIEALDYIEIERIDENVLQISSLGPGENLRLAVYLSTDYSDMTFFLEERFRASSSVGPVPVVVMGQAPRWLYAIYNSVFSFWFFMIFWILLVVVQIPILATRRKRPTTVPPADATKERVDTSEKAGPTDP